MAPPSNLVTTSSTKISRCRGDPRKAHAAGPVIADALAPNHMVGSFSTSHPALDQRFSSGILSQASQSMSRPGKATFLNGHSLASQSRTAENNRDSSPL